MSKSTNHQGAYLRWLSRQLSSPGATTMGATYLDLRAEYKDLTTKLSPTSSRVRRAARAAKQTPTNISLF